MVRPRVGRKPNDRRSRILRRVVAQKICGIDDGARREARFRDPVERRLEPGAAATHDLDPVEALARLKIGDVADLGVTLDQRELLGAGLLQNAQDAGRVDGQFAGGDEPDVSSTKATRPAPVRRQPGR